MIKNLAGFILGILCLARMGYAQGDAFTTPLSDRVIKFSITLPMPPISEKPESKKIDVTVRDGTIITIRDERNNYAYGFVPYLDKNNQVFMMAFEIGDAPGGGDSLKQLAEPYTLSQVVQTRIPTRQGNFLLNMESIDKWSFPTIRPLDPKKPRPRPSELEKIYGKSGGGSCCVSCGPLTVCATSVDMFCGSCDSAGGPRTY